MTPCPNDKNQVGSLDRQMRLPWRRSPAHGRSRHSCQSVDFKGSSADARSLVGTRPPLHAPSSKCPCLRRWVRDPCCGRWGGGGGDITGGTGRGDARRGRGVEDVSKREEWGHRPKPKDELNVVVVKGLEIDSERSVSEVRH